MVSLTVFLCYPTEPECCICLVHNMRKENKTKFHMYLVCWSWCFVRLTYVVTTEGEESGHYVMGKQQRHIPWERCDCGIPGQKATELGIWASSAGKGWLCLPEAPCSEDVGLALQAGLFRSVEKGKKSVQKYSSKEHCGSEEQGVVLSIHTDPFPRKESQTWLCLTLPLVSPGFGFFVFNGWRMLMGLQWTYSSVRKKHSWIF